MFFLLLFGDVSTGDADLSLYTERFTDQVGVGEHVHEPEAFHGKSGFFGEAAITDGQKRWPVLAMNLEKKSIDAWNFFVKHGS